MGESESTSRELRHRKWRKESNSRIMKGNFLKISLIALLGASLGTGLTVNAPAANVVGSSLKQGTTEPEFYQVPKNNTAMHLAVQEARKTIKTFVAALRHPAPGQEDFELKKRFVQGDQVEHIWLSNVKIVGNHFEGQIDNQPRKIQGLQLGQVVSVKRNEISDWLYIENGTLVGGYTVRAHYDQLTPQQKQEFDREADFKIGKP
jgi:uncharacterized protein YegJ (DUF2314 family)